MPTAEQQLADALDLVALVIDRWPQPAPTDEWLQRYAEDIADFDADVMRAAIDAVHRDGVHFRPTAGELRNRAARLELAPPEWVEVRRQLVQRRAALKVWNPPPWECPLNDCDGSGMIPDVVHRGPTARCGCWPQRDAHVRLAESLDPLVREFIAEKYVTWSEVDKIGEGAGDSDGLTLEAQVRNKWEAFVRRAVESRTLATITAAPDLPRLEKARDEDDPRRRQDRGRLARPNFAGALPSGDA